MSPTILIVDDDSIARQHVELTVRRLGYGVETADGGAAALARLRNAGAPPIDLLILDLVMPDLDGLGVISRLRAAGVFPPIIAQTTPSSIESASAALCAGALDFVVKPASPERLRAAISNGLRVGLLEAELRRASRQSAGSVSFAEFFGAGEEMERAVRLAERAAKTSMPALIEGEAGAGKEILARAIHQASDRRARPFAMLRCAGVPAQAIEGLLFGETASEAEQRRPGKIAEAQGGTLYIGDICELPPHLQARLLRLVRDGEIDVAGARPMRVDVRLIVSTRRNLMERVKAGRFREDFYYRLNMHPIFAPPLRRRRDEIEGLARRFCARFSAEAGRFSRGLSAEAVALLCAYEWPGNIRQLETAIFRAAALCESADVTLLEFPQIAAQVGGYSARIPPLPLPLPAPPPPQLSEPCHFGADRAGCDAPDPSALPLIDDSGDMRPLSHLEAEAIRFALAHYRGRMSKIARKLGIGRSTLYRKLKEYGLCAALGPDCGEFAGAADDRMEGHRNVHELEPDAAAA